MPEPFEPYSIRNAPRREALTYDLPELVKSRIMFAVQHRLTNDRIAMNTGFDMISVLVNIAGIALRQYGGLQCNEGDRPDVAAVNHFTNTTVERSLDFIEFLFQMVPLGVGKTLVDDINEIFRQEGIGYAITPMQMPAPKEDVKPRTSTLPPHYGAAVRIDPCRPGFGGTPEGIIYPKVICKDTEYLHAEVVVPCLEALATPGYETANAEMSKAHKAYRNGDYGNAITAACASFESVIKTICPDHNPKAACASLVDLLSTKGVVESDYIEGIKMVCKVRNEYGDAHGKGPSKRRAAEKQQTDHLMQVTSAHITFLIRWAAEIDGGRHE